jgi:tripartite-type tricarboxylate transporter receptor subunit TctC
MRSLIALALLLASSALAMAQAPTWPSRPMSMFVAAAAGGPIDVFGRVLSERLSELLGQRVNVENVPGAGGMIGGQRAAQAAPDGSSFILGTIATHAHSQTLYRKPLYDALNDFEHVALLAELPLVLVARPDFPHQTFQAFAAEARAKPDSFTFGSAGAGSASHLGCLLLDQALGARMTHVPYRGTGPAMQDLRGGRIDLICEIALSAVPLIEARQVLALANMSGARSNVLPNLPTLAELGLPGVEAYTWTAIMLPKGTPASIVTTLNAALVQALETPAVRERLQQLGANIVAPERRTPAYLRRFVALEIEKWAGPIRASGAIAD